MSGVAPRPGRSPRAAETALLRVLVPFAWIVAMPLALLRRLGENGRLGDRTDDGMPPSAWRPGRGALLAADAPPPRTMLGSTWLATRRALRRLTGVSRSTP